MSAVPTLPPGPPSPQMWQLARSQLDFVRYMEACTSRYGHIFTMRVYPFDRFVIATSPADLQTIVTHFNERFIDGVAPALLEPMVGSTSLILSTGAMHRRQRRLLRPAFHGELFTRWSDRMTAIADDALDRLPVNRPVATWQPMREVALSLICRLVFGEQSPERFEALRQEIANGVDPRLGLLLWFPTLWRRDGRMNPARGLKRRRELVHRMLYEQIALHRADPELEQREDALALMIRANDENGDGLADSELRDQLLALLLAGHETTATALAWTLERLSRAPMAQARLIAELDEGREEYLDAVVRETLRTRPPVMDAVRTATSDVMLGGYLVPAGTMVSAGFTITHRRPDIWEDPLTFSPERFLDARPAPYSYMPFGGGIRHCIGASLAQLEVRVVIKAVLRRFTVAQAPGPEEGLRLIGITLIPSRGARIVLQPRQDADVATTAAPARVSVG